MQDQECAEMVQRVMQSVGLSDQIMAELPNDECWMVLTSAALMMESALDSGEGPDWNITPWSRCSQRWGRRWTGSPWNTTMMPQKISLRCIARDA